MSKSRQIRQRGDLIIEQASKEKVYVAMLSYGKDSMAMLHVVKDVLHWPLDRIVTADVWATDTIPADFPLMVEFKTYADEEIKRRWGIEVEHFCANKVDSVEAEKVTYEKYFYQEMKKGKYIGDIKGFPMMRSWCIKLKLNALNKLPQNCIRYLGIAADEPNRFHNASETKLLPLVEAEWTEQMCREWCEQNNLLSPIYTTSTRGGCWFCHKQGVEQLRLLRHNYPDLWEMLLKWDNDSPVPFHSDCHTVHDFEKRFQWEDDGFWNESKSFRWQDLNEPQYNIEQFTNGNGGEIK